MDTQAIRRRIRHRKEDSAFVYFVLEAHEGVASYSTLDFAPGDLHRDLELLYSPDTEAEIEEVLTRLGPMVYALPGTEVAPAP